MGVRDPGEAIGRILSKPDLSHPWAHGSFGYWVIQREPAPQLGWVLARNTDGKWVFDAYAYCRDENNRRPWLKTFETLNSAVAWMIQHEAEIRALIAACTPEID